MLVAYSGGYNPAAYVLAIDGPQPHPGRHPARRAVRRRRQIRRLDRAATQGAFFFSAYTQSSEPGNIALQKLLQSKKIAFGTGIPTKFTLGSTNFFRADDDVGHNDFLTDAWENWPLKGLLQRVS